MTEKYVINGLVQGIGFRPSVKRIAARCGICGTVRNTGGAVEITAQGERKQLDEFKAAVVKIPQSIITSFKSETLNDVGFSRFEIIKSNEKNRALPVCTPDIAVCDRCLGEFWDSKNRRFMHPFISCTECGPRYSVLRRLPYDRENISMSDFAMCEKCGKEYADISNDRCHAQTIACPECGPRLSYTGGDDALFRAAADIKNGGVVAVKDIGGYHLACDALAEDAVSEIRRIKKRETKPFAVMFFDINEVRRYAEVSESEEKVLLSPTRPVVLLRKKAELAPSVCSRSSCIGAFLPCNPVQNYLTKECGPLVMTSANVSGKPIIADNEAMLELRKKTGGFEILSHDRDIVNPSDDSVCRVICKKVQMIRRARGYVPLPIEIDMADDQHAFLGLGGDLKAAFCYAKNGMAYMSRYFGDLENADVFDEWGREIAYFKELLGIDDVYAVSDMHPFYHSTRLMPAEKLQHHFAHMASVIAEHRLKASALGFIFDGTGYGEDDCVWGSEAIYFDGDKFHREAALEYVELAGGDEAARTPALTLGCFLFAAGIKGNNAKLLNKVLENHINTVKSSSMGRLFDAVSALLEISFYNSYEGESAILLEEAAAKTEKEFKLTLEFKDGKWLSTQLIRDISDAYKDGVDKNSLALGFHMAVARAVCDYAANRNEKNIILSGGVFSNRILTESCINMLEKNGHNVYINEKVPCNDGGIALGQAWYCGR